MRQFEPFTELLNRKQPWKQKIMRLIGRTNCARQAYTSTGPIEQKHLSNLNADLLKIKHELDETGYSGVFLLHSKIVEGIKADFDGNTFVNRSNPSEEILINFNNPENNESGHIYSNFDPHERSSMLKDFIETDLRPVAECYLGPKSRLINSQIWITFPGATAEINKDFGWHYDVDDYKFLKFFCYLSDVDDDSGPHAIVPSSHKSRHAYRFFNRQVDDRTVRTFGNPLTITGPAGSCFFEDTIIYHKGYAPKIKHRIILQVQFGVSQ